ncbi:MAG: hypothetical protein Q7J29_11535 [Stagnimonas sp.]|nr:hypothetical protein [Stagnimonas sp.]
MKLTLVLSPLSLAALLLGGCAPTSQLQLSSGRVGCASSEIVIGDVASTRHSESWSASCRGQTFYCSGTDDFREVICRPATKAVATAPTPAVAAPVMPPAPAAAAPPAPEVTTTTPEVPLAPTGETAPAATESKPSP